MTEQRINVISWDDYFMCAALLAAQRSKDPSTQVGAVIVNEENHIVATGYNGFPKGISNNIFPWGKEDTDRLKTKYLFVSHAESNAIDNRGSNILKGCKIYTTLYPCNSCAQRIIQNGLTEVIYLSDKHHELPELKAAKMLFEHVDMKIRQLIPQTKQLMLSLI